MSAVALDVEFLPPKVHRIIHEVICERKGITWANVLVGELSPLEWDQPSSKTDSVIFHETSESLDNHTCVKCERDIELHEQMHCLYEYEDGEPAFYLCPQCENAHTLGDSKQED